ncbi:MAG: CPBP family intramembrane metalloprotease [Planctomycetes bacterium]|nr:CPBP family intramembrane metalloprotease [Planctomycetota bacterium]
MFSFANIKQYKKILLLFLLILFASSIIAPMVKMFLDAFLPSNSFFVKLLDYENGSYNFARVMRRIIMAVAILFIFLLRKSLMFPSFGTIGLKPSKGCWQQLQMGFLISIGMFIFYFTFLYIYGTITFQMDIKSFGSLFGKLLSLILIAVIVGCVEELIFRGFIFQSVLRDTKVLFAVFFSSIFYSLLHFFKSDFLATPGFQPFVGFIVVYQSFANIILNIAEILPLIIGLFIVGTILSYAYLKSNSLYLPIGLHAGWVFLIKANRLFFDFVGSKSGWLFGDRKLINGLIGWIFLIVTLLIVHFFTKTLHNGKNPARAC